MQLLFPSCRGARTSLLRMPFLALLASIMLAGGVHVAGVAKSTTTSSSSSGKSMSSGFGSGKAAAPSAPSKPAAPAATKTGLGSFGASKTDASPAAAPPATTAMSRDLTANASKAAALKTLDQRNAAKATPAALPTNPSQSDAPSRWSNAAGYGYGQRDAPNAVPAPVAPPVVVYQGSNNNGGDLLTGIAIGSMMNHGNGNAAGYNGAGAPAAPFPAPATVASASSGPGFFTVLFYLLLIGFAGFAIWKLARFAMRSADPSGTPAPLKKQPNYRL